MEYNKDDFESLNSVNAILAEDSFNMSALTTKTQIHLKYGEYDTALDPIDTILSVFPKSYSALFHKYVVYIKKGDLESAGYLLDDIINSDEKNLDSIVNLNWVYDQILSEDEKNRFIIDYKSLLSRKKYERRKLESLINGPVHPLDKSKVYDPVVKVPAGFLTHVPDKSPKWVSGWGIGSLILIGAAAGGLVYYIFKIL